jgi:hypothetical protein
MESLTLAAALGAFIWAGFWAVARLADNDTIWDRIETWEEDNT